MTSKWFLIGGTWTGFFVYLCIMAVFLVALNYFYGFSWSNMSVGMILGYAVGVFMSRLWYEGEKEAKQ